VVGLCRDQLLTGRWQYVRVGGFAMNAARAGPGQPGSRSAGAAYIRSRRQLRTTSARHGSDPDHPRGSRDESRLGTTRLPSSQDVSGPLSCANHTTPIDAVRGSRSMIKWSRGDSNPGGAGVTALEHPRRRPKPGNYSACRPGSPHDQGVRDDGRRVRASLEEPADGAPGTTLASRRSQANIMAASASTACRR
jgi:hypothetical protein